MPRNLARWTLAAAALTAVALLPSHAWADRPELAFQLGRTFAVGSKMSDAYNQGGYTLSAGLLWPWEDRFRFGVQWFAADFGNQIGRVVVDDPSGGPSKDYGTVDFGHRGTWGAAWRADALGPKVRILGRSYATASYGYFRHLQDRVGKQEGSLSAVGGSLGLGFDHTLSPHHTLGVTANATWMSDDFTRHYGSAALEWRWHW